MKKILFLYFVFTAGLAKSQTQTAHSVESPIGKQSIGKYFSIETDLIVDKLVALRRKLHANPELAGKEANTQQVIKQYLTDLGMQVKTDIYGYAIVGILKGAKKGKSIAWRADMDALPNDFPDAVDFKSVNKNVQHGCGHDVHMAIALGIAEVLSKNKKHLKGTVYFIFQPEEESFTGAKGMLDGKRLAALKASEIYALHVTPFPVGQIAVKPNEMYAYQKGVRLQFKGEIKKETLHALYQKINSTLTRTINYSKPWEIQQALNPALGLTNPNTIFKSYCLLGEHFLNYTKNDTSLMEFDVYETDRTKLSRIMPAITQVVDSMGLAKQLISVMMFKENPTIQNNTALTTTAINTLNKIYGQGTVTPTYGQVPFSNDDFSYFQQQTPGVYFFLGGSNFAKGIIAMIHAPNFMVDEECIRIGVSRFAALLFQRLAVQ